MVHSMAPRAWVSYKQVFTRLYPTGAFLDRSLRDAVTFLADGRLAIRLATKPDVIDLGIQQPAPSTLVLSGDESPQEIETPDRRCRLEIDSFPQYNVTEFWLIHTDRPSGKFTRAKLTTEWEHHAGNIQPRLTVSPNGAYFLVDDSGVVRLYSAADLTEIGAFQVARAHTENRIVALAVSAGEQMIAALSSWSDVFLYSIPERRVVFVRNIRDGIGWYDPNYGYVMVTDDALAIVTIGVSSPEYSPQREPGVSVNAFWAVG
ncbi:MAG: hypothetical protein IT324_10555 [Anaerolineae bacterium]|nr:hypothetical protein [Anaerolineae bacterium]